MGRGRVVVVGEVLFGEHDAHRTHEVAVRGPDEFDGGLDAHVGHSPWLAAMMADDARGSASAV
jgi:hypothetical protein